jgi:hypothetical protein
MVAGVGVLATGDGVAGTGVAAPVPLLLASPVPASVGVAGVAVGVVCDAGCLDEHGFRRVLFA